MTLSTDLHGQVAGPLPRVDRRRPERLLLQARRHLLVLVLVHVPRQGGVVLGTDALEAGQEGAGQDRVEQA